MITPKFGVLQLVGAYGRKATQADWEEGKDFKIKGGSYCSIRDVERIKEHGYTEVELYEGEELVYEFYL